MNIVKVRSDLASWPETMAMADDLSMSAREVVGLMVEFWGWASEFPLEYRNDISVDVCFFGLCGYEAINSLFGVPFFAESLARVGHIDVQEDCVSILVGEVVL